MKKTSLKVFSLINMMLVPHLLVGCGNFKNATTHQDIFKIKTKGISVSNIAQEGPTLDAYDADVWGDGDNVPQKAQGDKSVIKYTGNGFVKGIDYGEKAGVTFHNITVNETGCYPLYVHYCTECDDASFRLYVKDVATSTSTFYSAINCISKTIWDHFEDYSVAQSYINIFGVLVEI